MDLNLLETEVRFSLGDKEAQKYSPQRLTNTIYKVLNHINQEFQIKVSVKYISITKYQEYITMPTDMFRVLQINNDSKMLKIISNKSDLRNKTSEVANNIEYLIFGERGFNVFGVQPKLSDPEINYVILDSTETVTTPDWSTVQRVIYRENTYYLLYGTSTVDFDFDSLPSYAVSGTSSEQVVEIVYLQDISTAVDDIDLFPSLFFDYAVFTACSMLLTEDNRAENVKKAMLMEQRKAAAYKAIKQDAQVGYHAGDQTTGYNTGFE